MKAKARIDHAKNAQLAYMVHTGDIVYKDPDAEIIEPTDYDPLG